MVRFTLRPLCPQGKIPQFPLNRRLVGSKAGEDALEKITIYPAWNRTLILRYMLVVQRISDRNVYTSFPWSLVD
jgi:hypothetical protein